MSDDLTPPPVSEETLADVLEGLREAALLCGADDEFFAKEYLDKAIDTIEQLRAERDDWLALYQKEHDWRSRLQNVVTSVHAELLAGGSLARLRALTGLKEE